MSDPWSREGHRERDGERAGIALIALGGNLPWRGLFGAGLCAAALDALAERGVRVLRASSVISTPAWPDPSAPAYWNAVAQVDVGPLSPEAVLAGLLAVEALFGRVRSEANAPRTLDLDLLDLDGRIRPGPDPTLPHPRMADRRFVLEPIAEIAPDWRHPVLGLRAGDLIGLLGPAT